MLRSGSSRENRIRSCARSAMRTGLPTSSAKTSPPLPITAARNTNCTASGIVMK